MSAGGGDNCFVVPSCLAFSLFSLSLLISVPNLVGCQTTELGNVDGRKKERK